MHYNSCKTPKHFKRKDNKNNHDDYESVVLIPVKGEASMKIIFNISSFYYGK